MKLRLGLLALTSVALAGCASQSQIAMREFANGDKDGLPKFKLIRVIDGGLLQLTESGDVLTYHKQGVGYSGNEVLPGSFTYPTAFNDYSDTVQDKCVLGLSSTQTNIPIEKNSFIDNHGKPVPYLKPQPILHIENGKKIGLMPLRIPSSDFRYYQSSSGIYACPRSTGIIKKIANEKLVICTMLPDQTLLASKRDESGLYQTYQIGLNLKPKLLAEVVAGTPVDLNVKGELLIQMPKNFLLIRADKSQLKLESGTSMAKFLKIGDKQYPIGFGLWKGTTSEDRMTTPVMWNQEGKAVKLISLCPDLSKIVPIKNLTSTRVLCNSRGMIAFEMSGYTKEAQSYDDASHIRKTYLLQAVDSIWQ